MQIFTYVKQCVGCKILKFWTVFTLESAKFLIIIRKCANARST